MPGDGELVRRSSHHPEYGGRNREFANYTEEEDRSRSSEVDGWKRLGRSGRWCAGRASVWSASGFTGALASEHRLPWCEGRHAAADGRRCFKHTHSPANAGLARLLTRHSETMVFGFPELPCRTKNRTLSHRVKMSSPAIRWFSRGSRGSRFQLRCSGSRVPARRRAGRQYEGGH
jgi:hypothetical protein